MYGRLAQLGEHLPYKQGVIGSSPIATTIFFTKNTIIFPNRRFGCEDLRKAGRIAVLP